jgi:hypothetical protein
MLGIHENSLSDLQNQLATATTSTQLETALRKLEIANAESNSKRQTATHALRDTSATRIVGPVNATSMELKAITAKPKTESAHASRTLAEIFAKCALKATTDIQTANVRSFRRVSREIVLMILIPQLASATKRDRSAISATKQVVNVFAGQILLENTVTSARTATMITQRVLVSILGLSLQLLAN